MKPRAFIGSSVEGLTVAYAVQQNLLHDAEITVWDQGVFELSSSTVESLTKALSSNDFGIFIFSPDDTIKMRGSESASVRDNVLFELGLFIGKLGRERVFFLQPSGIDFHIPSDLLGVTPGKYEINRTDGSMQAATGPACHQMRVQIKKLGPIESRIPVPGHPEEANTPETEKRSWVSDFLDEKYEPAKTMLQEMLSTQTGDEAIETQAWIRYCELKQQPSVGLEPLYDISRTNAESVRAQTIVAGILALEQCTDKAIALLLEAKRSFVNRL